MSVHLSLTSRSEHMHEGSTSVRESGEQKTLAATGHSVQKKPNFKVIAIVTSIATAALGSIAGGIAFIATGISIALGITLIAVPFAIALTVVGSLFLTILILVSTFGGCEKAIEQLGQSNVELPKAGGDTPAVVDLEGSLLPEAKAITTIQCLVRGYQAKAKVREMKV